VRLLANPRSPAFSLQGVVVGPAAGSIVALLDQHNKGTASDKSAASADAGELCVSTRYFGISSMYGRVLMFVKIVTYIHTYIDVRLSRLFVLTQFNTIVSKVRE
jgi:hypothetical protein